jgi:uncharacterized protein
MRCTESGFRNCGAALIVSTLWGDWMNSNGSTDLCFACGLCCNGVLFADLKLRSADDVSKLAARGLPVQMPRAGTGGAPRLDQPCAAFDGCRCGVYADRPQYCREFECALLREVNAGGMETKTALRTIQSARLHAERVRTLLRELGDADEHLPLNKRFRRTKRRLEMTGLDQESARVFGQLTLAVQDLNMKLVRFIQCE